MCKKIGESVNKNLSGNYSQKIMVHTEKFATVTHTIASKRIIQKTAEASCDLIGNNVADKATKIPKISPYNVSGTVSREKDDKGFDVKKDV